MSFAAGWLSWVDSTSPPDVIKGVEHCLLTDKFLSDLSALRSLIVARVKFEPESSSSHESSSSQFRVNLFFTFFFPIISFDYTVNIIVKKMSDS